MEYTVIRSRGLGDDCITIKEKNFNCIVPSPSGKYKLMELPCKECCNITLHFVIETKKGNKFISHGVAFLSFYCIECGYRSESSDTTWSSLEKMDLYRTCLDYIKELDNETRQKWIKNISTKYELGEGNDEQAG